MMEYPKNVAEVTKFRSALKVKLEIEGMMINVAIGYSPPVGCEMEGRNSGASEVESGEWRRIQGKDLGGNNGSRF